MARIVVGVVWSCSNQGALSRSCRGTCAVTAVLLQGLAQQRILGTVAESPSAAGTSGLCDGLPAWSLSASVIQS